MSWLNPKYIEDTTFKEVVNVINYVHPSGNMYTLKCINIYPFSPCEEDVYLIHKFYDEHNKLVCEYDCLNDEDQAIEMFDEFFYENIYDIILDDNMNIRKRLIELFKEEL